MGLDIKIEEQPAQQALEIAVEIRMWQVPKTLADGFAKILRHIEASGAEASGAPYARYLEMNWDAVRREGPLAAIWQLLTRKLKMRIGIPVTAKIAAAGDIAPVETGPHRSVTAIHVGAYHQVGRAYKEIARWAETERVEMTGTATESYITDPGKVRVEDLQTRILIPLSRAVVTEP